MAGSARRRTDTSGKVHAAIAAAVPASWAELAELDTEPIADGAVRRMSGAHDQMSPRMAKEKCFEPATMK